MPMRHGKKQKRNISGLKNQPKPLPEPSSTEPLVVEPSSESNTAERVGSDLEDDEDQDLGLKCPDSSKLLWRADDDEEEPMPEGKGDSESGIEDWDTHQELEDKGLYIMLMNLAVDNGDDPRDEDWVPEDLRRKRRRKKKVRPSQYVKGPDVGSKSLRTQCRYRELLVDQKTLDAFGFAMSSISPTAHQPLPEDISLQNLPMAFPMPRSITPSPVKAEEQMTPLRSNDTSTWQATPGRVRAESMTPPPLGSPDCPSPMVHIREESMTPPRIFFNDERSSPIPIQEELVTPPPLFDVVGSTQKRPRSTDKDGEGSEDELNDDVGDNEDEPWEAEVRETLTAHVEIRGWKELRDQIKKDLKTNHATLPLSQINQLMILRNFATLCLKGQGRMPASYEIAKQWHEKDDGSSTHFARRIRALARHYQIFEQLPVEHRGGRKNAKSLLKDETIKTAARTWLTEQPVGSITPQNFAHGLNTQVLPSLGVSLTKPLCERTARRWLVQLGWSRTVLRKGVYMDGHEREDVVKYRESVFLPKMEEFERRMAQYEGPELRRIEPSLLSGEKELIAEFHDESCCQANEFKSSAWLQEGEQILQKKGRGRLIHISDFIEEGNGRLICRNSEGSISRDARKVIYPGSSGDPYWDCNQLIEQVQTSAIPIFEAAHPGCQALFVFDQSSAHAALPEDALKAFEMNKSNGGKQRHQKDTVIPDNNPTLEHRGKIQKMTTDDGQQKGLQQTLEERGFNVTAMRAKCSPVCPWENSSCCMARLLSKQDDFVNQISRLEILIKDAGHECIFLPKFHCELNPIEMYWGWVKYRYRQVPKKTFDDAKKAAFAALDACPVNVIRRFINRAWRFMSAYRVGLTGKAAAWAVRKQKGHRSVSQGAMMHLDAIINPT